MTISKTVVPNALVVITGFMGTGKTSVGRIVAQQLAREFVDVDQVIAAREGVPVYAIFETWGEEYFRARESELCAELCARDRLVIATGGGALLDPRNREMFANAFIVCLDASPDAILARLSGARDRPLLAQGDLRPRVEALLKARREAYAQIESHIDTTEKSVEQVAAEVLEAFEQSVNPMEEARGLQALIVHTPDGDYPISIASGSLAQVGTYLPSIPLAAQERRQGGEAFSSCCAVVTHPRLGKLYAPRVVESLRAHNFEPHVMEIPEGEKFKTLETARALYDQLLDAGLDRRSMILALGGGVVGDVAGFVAATFLRGVPLVQLPTTLLAMVDASIGGKVGVNHARGKNLIGAYKQPRAVIVDPDALATLPEEEFRSGLAEVVKHAMVGDAGLFRVLESGDWRWENRDWLEDAIRVKVEIVGRDPFEKDERAKLNLGHTFGHALEQSSGYEMRHGDAVAIGLVCAARLAAGRRLCDASLVTRITHLLGTLNLPTRVPTEFSADAILEAMQVDKKRMHARLRFVLPRALGDVVVVDDVTSEETRVAIESNRD